MLIETKKNSTHLLRGRIAFEMLYLHTLFSKKWWLKSPATESWKVKMAVFENQHFHRLTDFIHNMCYRPGEFCFIISKDT